MTQWFTGTLLESHMIADNVKALRFSVPEAPKHIAGQHYDIKLTAPDGYVAERSYSIASLPDDVGIVELGVELLENGEVSPFLYQMKSGDQIELRGPIGGHFVWNTHEDDKPIVLVGGGSGFVPLMSMLREYVKYRDDTKHDIRILVSSRAQSKVVYYDELLKYSENFPEIKLAIALTDEIPKDWNGYTRRVDADMVREVCGDVAENARVFICGPNGFVAAVAKSLEQVGFTPESIKTERFGGK